MPTLMFMRRPAYDRAAAIFEQMSTQEAFAEFLTLPLYEEIE